MPVAGAEGDAVFAAQRQAVLAHGQHAAVAAGARHAGNGGCRPGVDARPVLARVRAAVQGAAQAAHQQRTIGQRRAGPERAAVAGGQVVPAGALVIRVQHIAFFRRRVQRAAGAGEQAEQVQVRAPRARRRRQLALRPMAPAIAGGEHQRPQAHGDPVRGVEEVHGKQGPVLVRRAALELPALAAVHRVQHHARMAHGPALLFRGKGHARQRHVGRNLAGLAPGLALVVRQQHDAVRADGHGARPSPGGGQHTGLARMGRRFGRPQAHRPGASRRASGTSHTSRASAGSIGSGGGGSGGGSGATACRRGKRQGGQQRGQGAQQLAVASRFQLIHHRVPRAVSVGAGRVHGPAACAGRAVPATRQRRAAPSSPSPCSP